MSSLPWEPRLGNLAKSLAYIRSSGAETRVSFIRKKVDADRGLCIKINPAGQGDRGGAIPVSGGKRYVTARKKKDPHVFSSSLGHRAICQKHLSLCIEQQLPFKPAFKAAVQCDGSLAFRPPLDKQRHDDFPPTVDKRGSVVEYGSSGKTRIALNMITLTSVVDARRSLGGGDGWASKTEDSDGWKLRGTPPQDGSSGLVHQAEYDDEPYSPPMPPILRTSFPVEENYFEGQPLEGSQGRGSSVDVQQSGPSLQAGLDISGSGAVDIAFSSSSLRPPSHREDELQSAARTSRPNFGAKHLATTADIDEAYCVQIGEKEKDCAIPPTFAPPTIGTTLSQGSTKPIHQSMVHETVCMQKEDRRSESLRETMRENSMSPSELCAFHGLEGLRLNAMGSTQTCDHQVLMERLVQLRRSRHDSVSQAEIAKSIEASDLARALLMVDLDDEFGPRGRPRYDESEETTGVENSPGDTPVGLKAPVDPERLALALRHFNKRKRPTQMCFQPNLSKISSIKLHLAQILEERNAAAAASVAAASAAAASAAACSAAAASAAAADKEHATQRNSADDEAKIIADQISPYKTGSEQHGLSSELLFLEVPSSSRLSVGSNSTDGACIENIKGLQSSSAFPQTPLPPPCEPSLDAHLIEAHVLAHGLKKFSHPTPRRAPWVEAKTSEGTIEPSPWSESAMPSVGAVQCSTVPLSRRYLTMVGARPSLCFKEPRGKAK